MEIFATSALKNIGYYRSDFGGSIAIFFLGEPAARVRLKIIEKNERRGRFVVHNRRDFSDLSRFERQGCLISRQIWVNGGCLVIAIFFDAHQKMAIFTSPDASRYFGGQRECPKELFVGIDPRIGDLFICNALNINALNALRNKPEPALFCCSRKIGKQGPQLAGVLHSLERWPRLRFS